MDSIEVASARSSHHKSVTMNMPEPRSTEPKEASLTSDIQVVTESLSADQPNADSMTSFDCLMAWVDTLDPAVHRSGLGPATGKVTSLGSHSVRHQSDVQVMTESLSAAQLDAGSY